MKSLLLAVSLLMASLFSGLHPSTVFPSAPSPSAVATIVPAEASTVLSAPHLFSLAVASSGRPALTPIHAGIAQGVVLGTSTQVSYVTQDQLTAAISQAVNLLHYELYNSTSTIAYGGVWNAIAASQRINNLTGSSNGPLTISDATLSNISGLTASEIPNLSGTYLPLTGGTLSGLFVAPNASTTLFSNFGTAYFGSTATSSFDGAGDLMLAGTLTDSSTASSTFAGAIGIGTNSPLSALTVSGGASIGADYNTAAPTNGLTVEGNVAFGTTSPRIPFGATSPVNLDVVTQDASTEMRVAVENPTKSRFPSIFIDSYQNSFAGEPQFAMRNWDGSVNSPTSIPFNHSLGQIVWESGFDTTGNDFVNAEIQAATQEATSPTNMGGFLQFFTTPLGGSSIGTSTKERLRITANGAVGINTAAPSFQLDTKGWGIISTTTFSGTGLNDATSAGTYTGTDISTVTYTVIIDGTGTPDTFKWQKNAGSFTTGVAITGGSQTLTDGVQVKFVATTGHTLNDQWLITVTPVNPFGVQNDAGTRSFSVENNGDVGIGTTSPNSLLEISVSNANTTLTTFGDPTISITNRSTTNNTFANLAFQTQSANGASSTVARISGIATSHTNGAVSGNLAFLINNAGTVAEAARITAAGNFGIGTSTPYARLTVWGADSASSTLAFNVVSNASTTVFGVFDGGNAQLSGTLTQSSDRRLKTDIQPLDASSSLSLIDALNPVTFNWIDPSEGTTPQLGFIAQQVQQIFPNLISTTSATALTPDGTLGLNYIGLISPIVSAIQALSSEVQNLITEVQGYAQKFTTNQLCVNKSDGTPVCVTGDQLATLLARQSQQQVSSPAAAASSASTTPPTITISGDNPATIQVGDSYADLGATVSDIGPGQAGDTDLGYKTFLNGILVSNIVLDTSQVATDTIDYVATDTDGFTATSTRIVLIEFAANSLASTTEASSTAQ